MLPFINQDLCTVTLNQTPTPPSLPTSSGAHLPCGRLDVDGAASAREGTFHSEKEAALCVGLLDFFGA